MRKYNKISFPKSEHDRIKQRLGNNYMCSTVRCCKELNKYKLGHIYETSWKDLVKIIKIRKFTNISDIPTIEYMDDKMKESIKMGEKHGNSLWEYIQFKKTNHE